MDFKQRSEELRDLLTSYQRAYYTTGRALVSDIEYDRLFDELTRIEQAYPELKTPDSPTQRVGSDLSADFPEVEHTIPVLSLDKAYSSEEIYKFISGSRKKYNDNLSFVLEEKIDGFSMVLYYRDGVLEKAVTRGNGAVGNDVTANVRTIPSVPLRLAERVNIAVRGEVYLPKEDFEVINASLSEPYANPRNLAAGTIRRIKSSETARVPLNIFCYEGYWEESTPFTDHIQILSRLKQLGFRVDSNLSYYCRTSHEARLRLEQAGLEGNPKSFDDIPADIEERTKTRASLKYEIDGLVMKVNELAVRDAMGYTEHHPRWAIAYKFEAPQAESTIENIDVQVGRTGRITPMARITETQLSGSVIKNITLHNQDYIDALELAVGDTVAISKRGDVIPAVENVTEKNTIGNTTWKMPATCPTCGAVLEKRGAHHFCPNGSCPDQERGKLEFFCAKKQMDIEGLGSKTIEILYNRGYVRFIPDIYRFDFSALIRDGVEGFGRKKVAAITAGIEASKKKDFCHVLTSIGIPDVGKKVCQVLIDSGFTDIDAIFARIENREKAVEDFSLLEGIGPVLAKTIIDGLGNAETRSLIKELRDLGLNFSSEVSQAERAEDLIFDGQTWCVTGTFQNFKPREKAMEEIVKRGGREVTAVSSKTSCLLAGENAGSKLEKARQLGVKIVTEVEFLTMISKPEGMATPKEEQQLSLF